MAFLNRHYKAFAFALLAVEVILALGAVEESTVNQLYDNSIAACERGNVLRSVVYTNTRNAAAQPLANAGEFRDQLKILQGVEFTNKKDGTIDCFRAIPQP